MTLVQSCTRLKVLCRITLSSAAGGASALVTLPWNPARRARLTASQIQAGPALGASALCTARRVSQAPRGIILHDHDALASSASSESAYGGGGHSAGSARPAPPAGPPPPGAGLVLAMARH
jgi:hypothetical protein